MTVTQSQPPSNQTPSTPSCLIQRCQDLELEIFIEINEDGDHSRLGAGDTEAAWLKIREQYNGLTGGVAYKDLVKLTQEINYLTTKLKLMKMLSGIMRTYYLPQFGEILSLYGFKADWDNITDEERMQHLNIALAGSKQWIVKLNAKKKEYDALVSKNPKAEPVTMDREYFEDWLIGLSKDQGYQLNSRSLSVFQFGMMVNRNLETARKEAKAKKKK